MIAVYVMPESLTKEQYNKAREALAATDANFDGRKHHSCIGEEGKLVLDLGVSGGIRRLRQVLDARTSRTRHQAKVTGHHARSEPGNRRGFGPLASCPRFIWPSQYRRSGAPSTAILAGRMGAFSVGSGHPPIWRKPFVGCVGSVLLA